MYCQAHLAGALDLADAMAVSPTVTRLGPEDPASAGWLATRLTRSRNVSRRRPGCCCCCCADAAAACRPGLHGYVTSVFRLRVLFMQARHRHLSAPRRQLGHNLGCASSCLCMSGDRGQPASEDRSHAHNGVRWLGSCDNYSDGLDTHLAVTLDFEGDGIVGGRPTLKNSPGKALPAPAPQHVTVDNQMLQSLHATLTRGSRRYG